MAADAALRAGDSNREFPLETMGNLPNRVVVDSERSSDGTLALACRKADAGFAHLLFCELRLTVGFARVHPPLD